MYVLYIINHIHHLFNKYKVWIFAKEYCIVVVGAWATPYEWEIFMGGYQRDSPLSNTHIQIRDFLFDRSNNF